MRNRPGPPRASAKPCTQSARRFIVESVDYKSLLTRRPAVPTVAASVVFLAGSAAALYYFRLGLSLSHYDARAHLVVSRRILDSMSPGWQQIGAVWLPLPHLLNMLPVQIDLVYRTGASAIALSVLGMSAAAWALARLVVRTTGSPAAAFTGAGLLLANPNLLYLQSTPMTEPLLFATTILAVVLTAEWVDAGAVTDPRAAGWALVAACLTRYEAWPVTAALVALTGLVLVRRGATARNAVRACWRLCRYPVVAIAFFVVNSRWTTAHWFLTSGFFVAENEALGHGWLAWRQVRMGTYLLSGSALVWSAYASAVLIVATFVRSRQRAGLVLLLALAASGALPWYAYVQGHPLRVRYSLPLVFAACALCAGGVGLLPRRLRAVTGVLVVAAVLLHQGPVDLSAPMVREAQRDAVNRIGRTPVTAYLVDHRDGGVIMMSMGSLAHYMQDLSAQGFRVRDFLHEGNGELWPRAIDEGPRGFVQWIVVEEKAEGGDALFLRAKEMPEFYRGFERVAEGGGVALFRAVPQGSTWIKGSQVTMVQNLEPCDL